MFPLDLLLIGDAGDGPVEQILPVRDARHAMQIWGGHHYEALALAEAATGHTLAISPWGDEVDVLIADSDGALVPRILFEFAVDGPDLTWTKNGDWDRYEDADPEADPTLYFRCPKIPGQTSLLRGIHAALPVAEAAGFRIHCVRLGGVQAAVTQDGFTFIARWPGARYNGTTVEVTVDGEVIVTPAPGTGRLRTYTPTSDKHLWELLGKDRDRYWQPLFFSGSFSEETLTVPVGVYTLVGGTDGALSPQALFEFLQEYDLTGIDVICPVGLTTEQLRDAGVTEYVAGENYPLLLVTQSEYTAPTLPAHPNTDRCVVSVGFQVIHDGGTGRERTEGAQPLVAALLAAGRYGLTHGTLGVPLGGTPANPTETQLREAAAVGHVLGFRSVLKGPALWHAVTGDPLWPASTYRALQEISRICYQVLEPRIGRAISDLAPLEIELVQSLNTAESGKVSQVSLQFLDGILYVQLTFRPLGEVREVKAQLAVASAFAV